MSPRTPELRTHDKDFRKQLKDGKEYELHKHLMKFFIMSLAMCYLASIDSLAQNYTDQEILWTAERADKALRDGRYKDAIKLYEQSVFMAKKKYGYNVDTAVLMIDLGLAYKEVADYPKAEFYLRKSVEILEKDYGHSESNLSKGLNNLATLYLSTGDYDKAEPLLQRAIEIETKTMKYSMSLAVLNSNLAKIYSAAGNYSLAIALYKDSLKIMLNYIPIDHINVATLLSNIAYCHHYLGEYSIAEKYLKKSLGIKKKTYGNNHRDVAMNLFSLANLYNDMQRWSDALPVVEEALLIYLENIYDFFPIASERQKLSILKANEFGIDIFFTTILGMNNQQNAASIGLTGVLRLKGVVLDSIIGERETIKNNMSSDIKKTYEALQLARQHLADLYIRGGDENTKQYRIEIEKYENRIDELESVLSRKSESFQQERSKFFLNMNNLCEELPENSTYIEYVEFSRFDHDSWRDWMIAFVITQNNCTNPVMVDLGPTELIENAIKAWRKELIKLNDSNNNKQDAMKKLDQVGGQISDLIWRPLTSVLKSNAPEKNTANQLLYISPDGPIHLMPIGAIPFDGKYVLEDFRISYVTSGKDFIKTPKSRNVSASVLLVGGADYDMQNKELMSHVASHSVQRGNCEKLRKIRWKYLPGSKKEIDAIAPIFRKNEYNVTVLKGHNAQELNVRNNMAHTNIIHLATHGFFLGDECDSTIDDRGIGGVRKGPRDTSSKTGKVARSLNPLLLSGLVFSGANNVLQNNTGINDGYLLAMEVANLDLSGVELVTLSACQTGLGEIKRGEGVFGLKRSFIIAGSNALILTLWNVPDKETKYLMIDFYKRMLSGTNKSEALRRAQLKIMRSGSKGAYRHPFFWAAFQYVGVN